MSEVIVLLEVLESELCRQDVWLPMPPPVEAMIGTTPYYCQRPWSIGLDQ